jgi:hypothetical protein
MIFISCSDRFTTCTLTLLFFIYVEESENLTNKKSNIYIIVLMVGEECSWCDWPGHCTIPLYGQIFLYQNMCNVANVLVIIITATTELDNHTYN